MAIYKTIYRVEVLSEGRIPEEMSLGDVFRETVVGEFSGHIVKEEIWGPLKKGAVVSECRKHGTDPEFFLGDDWETGDA